MREKAISVIVPCYNSKKYLPRCVSSLLDQTIGLENLELIFVDDASADGTLEYLYELEQQYPSEVMVVSCDKNQGQAAARNIGLGYASGKYIGFVDADDWVLPQMYEELYEKAEQTGCELVDSFSRSVKDEDECAQGRFLSEKHDNVYIVENDAQRRELLAVGLSIFNTVCVWSKLYRRDFLEKYQIRFGEKYVFEDIYFLNMLLFFVDKFCTIQAEYYHYYVHPDNTMTSMNPSKWFAQRKTMQAWLGECIDRGLLENYYHEIELVFVREYYLSNLHCAFMNGEENGIEPIVQNSRIVTERLFPDAENNPYIVRGVLHDCQKELVAYISKGFSQEDVEKIREDYLKKALGLVKKKKNVEQPEITVMLAADKKYLYPAMVLLTSLFYNHPRQKVTAYLLQKGFQERDLQEVQAFADRWEEKEICCIEVPEERIGSLKAFGRFSVAAFFRILGMVLLPKQVQRALYLDADMVVNQNLSELFSKEMKTPIAACYDINNDLQGNIEYHKADLGIPPEYSYFNSGMILMDLEYMRENEVAEKLILDIEKHFEEYSLVDQDALNKFFYRDVEILPWRKYNCPCVPFLSKSAIDGSDESLIRYSEIFKQGKDFNGCNITDLLMEDAKIIHFCTPQKPWRDRDFYEGKSMKRAKHIYLKYEQLYREMCGAVFHMFLDIAP